VQVMKKKPKPGKAARSGRLITKEEPVESFFNFFSPPVLPEADDDDEDEEEFEQLREALEDDLSVGYGHMAY
jgi:nucleosome assembly protein 1-like 1